MDTDRKTASISARGTVRRGAGKVTKKSEELGVDAIFEMPGHLLRRCHQIAVAIFIAECEQFDLTPLQYVALAALARNGPQDQATLGGITALDRTTVAVVIKNLEERGLASRHASKKDKRSKIVEITDAGRDLMLRAKASVEHAQDRTVAPLTSRERDQLIRLLTTIADKNNALSRAPKRVRQRAQEG